MRETKKVFVTKYALTTGIFLVECEIVGKRAYQWEMNSLRNLYSEPEYSLTKEEALSQAEELRIKKLKSLDKQINKISKIDFEEQLRKLEEV